MDAVLDFVSDDPLSDEEYFYFRNPPQALFIGNETETNVRLQSENTTPQSLCPFLFNWIRMDSF